MKSIYLVLMLLLTTALTGCFGAAGKCSVKGKVMYGSKVVKYGEVIVYGGDGIPKTGKIARDGTYQVDDVTSGDARIAVRAAHPKDAIGTKSHDEKATVDPVDVQNYVALPSSYADPNSSGLTVTLKTGENSHNISLAEK